MHIQAISWEKGPLLFPYLISTFSHNWFILCFQGAGDSFIGSLAYYISTHPELGLAESVRRSIQIASISVQKPGTQTSFPLRAELPQELFWATSCSGSIKRRATLKTLTRLGGCPGWSGSLLGSQVILLVLSCSGSIKRRATSWHNHKMACAPSEDSDQPGHLPSLIRVFAVRIKKAWILSYPLSIHPVWSASSLCTLISVAKDPNLLQADSENSDQTGPMPRLIGAGWSESSLGAQVIYFPALARLSWLQMSHIMRKICLWGFVTSWDKLNCSATEASWVSSRENLSSGFATR